MLQMAHSEGLFTWREEDPRGRIIIAPYVFSKVVLGPSAKIFLEIGTF